MIKKISISGMHCGHCVRAVEEVLQQIPDIKEFKVQIGEAEITVSNSWAADALLATALEKERYPVVTNETVDGTA